MSMIKKIKQRAKGFAVAVAVNIPLLTGETVGLFVIWVVGAIVVGFDEGAIVGEIVGIDVVGVLVGESVGATVGIFEGDREGDFEGRFVGDLVGRVGFFVGLSVGDFVGGVGALEGDLVGGVGDIVGLLVGTNVGENKYAYWMQPFFNFIIHPVSPFPSWPLDPKPKHFKSSL